MSRKISQGRKTAYYGGVLITILGLLLFLSVFFTAASNFGNFDDFQRRSQSSMFRAISGIILIGVGQFVSRIGARGLAGSGVVLDPDQARSDLKPYSKMAGGMLDDAIEESGIPGQLESRAERVVTIKCRDCGKLNEEDSRFCQECGQAF